MSGYIGINLKDIIMDEDLGIFVLDLFEACLHYKYKPKRYKIASPKSSEMLLFYRKFRILNIYYKQNKNKPIRYKNLCQNKKRREKYFPASCEFSCQKLQKILQFSFTCAIMEKRQVSA